jgi:hypothetical protein
MTLAVLVLLILNGCTGGKVTEAPAISDPPAYDSSSATALVSGSILFEGVPRKATPTRAADPFCRKFGPIKNEEVLVTPDGKLQNVIVYVRSGHEGRSYRPPVEPVLLDQQGCVYLPHVFTLMTNQELKIRNSENTFHNVRAQTNANAPFNIGQPVESTVNTQTFTKPEIPIHIGCDLHRWMASYVGVFDHPFHTTSSDTGKYELRLPPGRYEIAAWHEKYGERVATVEVSDKGTAELNFIFSEIAAN